jgi:hypothetical protein
MNRHSFVTIFFFEFIIFIETNGRNNLCGHTSAEYLGLFLILIFLSIMLRKNIIYMIKKQAENLEGVLPT